MSKNRENLSPEDILFKKKMLKVALQAEKNKMLLEGNLDHQE